MDEEINHLKNEFYSILEIIRKEMDEMKREIHLLREKEMNEYNKLLSNYVPLKEKQPVCIKVIDGVEYILDNNILFNDLGEIVGKLDGDEITKIE
jgi:hypothetical protein